MEDARSQAFQRVITKLSDDSSVPHQIIFTTSKIAPELNNEAYCIGPFYDDDNKTLSV